MKTKLEKSRVYRRPDSLPNVQGSWNEIDDGLQLSVEAGSFILEFKSKVSGGHTNHRVQIDSNDFGEILQAIDTAYNMQLELVRIKRDPTPEEIADFILAKMIL